MIYWMTLILVLGNLDSSPPPQKKSVIARSRVGLCIWPRQSNRKEDGIWFVYRPEHVIRPWVIESKGMPCDCQVAPTPKTIGLLAKTKIRMLTNNFFQYPDFDFHRSTIITIRPNCYPSTFVRAITIFLLSEIEILTI